MRALAAASANLHDYKHDLVVALKHLDVLYLINPWPTLRLALNLSYILLQLCIIALFKPSPPKGDKLEKPYGRIAIVGAGLTGVSSAAHAIAHNFDVVIYEEKQHVGGIWANVNKTSGLQLNSLLYRFHPAVLWSRAFPFRDEILSEIRRVWKEYKLEPRTRFGTPVMSIRRANDSKSPGAKWIVNDGEDGVFDAVIVTVGTCGKPMMVGFPGMPQSTGDSDNFGGGRSAVSNETDEPRPHEQDEPDEDDSRDIDEYDDAPMSPGEGAPSYAAVASEGPTRPSIPSPPASHTSDVDSDTRSHVKESHPPANDDSRDPEDDTPGTGQDAETFSGTMLHSSELDDADLVGKTVLVVGSGASGVEAVETALQRGAGDVYIFARDDKWIIPRNIVIDTSISAQPFGQEMPLSILWEKFLTYFQYRGVEDLVPADKGIYESTPVVNDEFLAHVRSGRCKYIRGDTLRLTTRGVHVRVRPRGSKSGDEGPAGSQYPEEDFDGDVVVLATGFHKPEIDFLPKDLFPEGYDRPNLYLQNFSVEDWSVLMTNSAYQNAIGHIGIYTRILLLLLLDPDARPEPRDMRLWVDAERFVKRGARGGALGFFTYMELVIWFITFHLFRPDRLRWIFFTMQGWGKGVNRVK
ncbi:FAD/NAD-P-binding domain-containing protein [Artomyces pyxidatus]|uniref:FAD/NAD-P-binding domain-containing protein n=1 Tax=Artomyces pyxidatus TaxID=48021 RepID=A0ACB8TAT2_9AGAM|nr:FAD/NAD-P-binding domain-containing protein [Artomyces pyxidatus]